MVINQQSMLPNVLRKIIVLLNLLLTLLSNNACQKLAHPNSYPVLVMIPAEKISEFVEMLKEDNGTSNSTVCI
jgi:hypothetical protein